MGQGYRNVWIDRDHDPLRDDGAHRGAGAIFIVGRSLSPKGRATLLRIGAFYLPFAAYYGGDGLAHGDAVVVGFVVIGVLGACLPHALVVGYCCTSFGACSKNFKPMEATPLLSQAGLTAIPLACGVFCAARQAHGA